MCGSQKEIIGSTDL